MSGTFSMTNSLRIKCPDLNCKWGPLEHSCFYSQTVGFPVSLFLGTLVFHLPYPLTIFSTIGLLPPSISSSLDYILSELLGNLTLCHLPWPWSFLLVMLFENGHGHDFSQLLYCPLKPTHDMWQKRTWTARHKSLTWIKWIVSLLNMGLLTKTTLP